MGRRSRLTLLVAAALILGIGLVFLGGQSVGCLGPLGVTAVQCIAAFDAAYEPDWSPGPGGGTWIVASVAILFVSAAAVPWPALSRRSLGVVVGVGVLGAALGTAIYAVTRPVSLTGPTSTGAAITVIFPGNVDAQLVDAVLGVGVAGLVAGLVLGRSSGRSGGT